MKLLGENTVVTTTTSTDMMDLLTVKDLKIPAYTPFHVKAEIGTRLPNFGLLDSVAESCLKFNGQPIASGVGRGVYGDFPFTSNQEITSVAIAGRVKDARATIYARNLQVWLEEGQT